MSEICFDCGVDTSPCTGKRGCRHAGRWEYYMVRDKVCGPPRAGRNRRLCPTV